MLSWSDVCEQIPGNPHEIISNNSEQLYESILYIWYPAELTDKNCLYFIADSIADQVTCSTEAGAIVIGDNSKQLIEKCKFSNSIFCNMEDGIAIYKRMSESFKNQDYYRSVSKQIISMVKENKKLDEITGFLSKALKRPIVIFDNSFHFLSRSSVEDIDSLVPEEDRAPDGMTLNRLLSLQKEGEIEKFLASNSFYRYIVGDFSISTIPLFVGKTKVAFLGFPGSVQAGDSILSPELIYELPHIADAVSLQLARLKIFLFNKAMCFPYIMSTILKNKNNDINDIRSRLKIFGYDLRSNLYLLCVSMDMEDVAKDGVITMADSMRRVFTNSIYLIRDREIIFLISRTVNNPVTSVEMDIWNGFLLGNGLHAGLTGPFADLNEVADTHLRETYLALDAGRKVNPEQGLYTFSELQPDALLTELSALDDLSMFRFQPLMRLIEYDKRRNTVLTATLREYIKNHKQPQQVCEVLFIHKNTLYKRLDRIREIMDCDLSDAEVIMRTQLTFHILKNQGNLK